jgi:Holliday junction DNA helicase RuvA
MFALIKGTVADKDESSVLVMVGGIGFELLVPYPEKIEKGREHSFYIYEQWKEDGVNLFGFVEKKDKELFELLIKKVSGIGAKTALMIFRHMDRESIIANIKKGDFKSFSRVPGIGEKTAKRIVVELGGNIEDYIEIPKSDNLKIAQNALLSLGYTNEQLKEAFKDFDDNNSLTVEEIVKAVIRKLSNV